MKWIELFTKLFPALCAVLRWLTGRKPNRGVALVVEDNDHDALLLISALRRIGYECQLARNVAEANVLLANEKFFVAFVDVRLPGVSGKELLQTISKDAPSCRVVVVCGEPGDLSDIEAGWPIVVVRKAITIKGLLALFDILHIK